MASSVVKRSVAISGHKTSVTLEDNFWRALQEIAQVQKMTVSSLLNQIDQQREEKNLSSHIRVFVLNYYRSRGSELR